MVGNPHQVGACQGQVGFFNLDGTCISRSLIGCFDLDGACISISCIFVGALGTVVGGMSLCVEVRRYLENSSWFLFSPARPRLTRRKAPSGKVIVFCPLMGWCS